MAFEGHGETPSGEAGGVGVLAAPGALLAGEDLVRHGMERVLGRCCLRRLPHAALTVLGLAEHQRGKPLPLPFHSLPLPSLSLPVPSFLFPSPSPFRGKSPHSWLPASVQPAGFNSAELASLLWGFSFLVPPFLQPNCWGCSKVRMLWWVWEAPGLEMLW